MLDQFTLLISENLNDWFIETKLKDVKIELNQLEKGNKKELTKVNISLVNIAYEAFGQQRNFPNTTSLNIKVLISVSNGSDYLKELRVLSAIIQYFNDNPVLENSSSLQERGLRNVSFKILETKESELPLLFLSKKKEFSSSIIYECRLATFTEGDNQNFNKNMIAGW